MLHLDSLSLSAYFERLTNATGLVGAVFIA